MLTDMFADRDEFADAAASDGGFNSDAEKEFFRELFDYVSTLTEENDPAGISDYLTGIQNVDSNDARELGNFIERMVTAFDNREYDWPEGLAEKFAETVIAKYKTLKKSQKAKDEDSDAGSDYDEDEKEEELDPNEEVIYRDPKIEEFVLKNISHEKPEYNRVKQLNARIKELESRPVMDGHEEEEYKQLEAELDSYKDLSKEYDLNTKSKFAQTTDLETFIKNSKKNGWLTSDETEALTKLYMLSEHVDYSELNSMLEKINSDNFALNSYEKMNYKTNTMKKTLSRMFTSQKSITSALMDSILNPIIFVEQPEINELYVKEFNTERPRTAKETSFDEYKAKSEPGTLFAADYTEHEFLELAEKNGWGEWSDYNFLQRLFEYRENNNWKENSKINNMLNTVLNKPGWSLVEREKIVDEFRTTLESDVKKELPKNCKEYIDNLLYYTDHMKNFSQEELDNSYRKIHGKDREKTAADLEREKENRQRELNKNREQFENLYNKNIADRQLVFDTSFEYSEQEFLNLAKNKGWILHKDEEALKILYNVARNSAKDSLKDMLNTILNTDASDYKERQKTSKDAFILVEDILMTADNQVKDGDISLMFNNETISIQGEDLKAISKIMKEDLLSSKLSEKYFDEVWAPVKAKRAAKAKAHREFEEFKNSFKLSPDEKSSFLKDDASRLKSDEDIAARANKMTDVIKERERQEAEARRLQEEERLRQEAEARRLEEEARQRQEAENRRIQEEQRQRQAEEANRRLQEEQRRKEEANNQIKERAKQQLLNNEKLALASGFNLAHDLVGVYNTWKDEAIGRLRLIKTNLSNSIPEDFEGYGQNFLDAIQNTIDTLGDPTKTNREIHAALNNLYEKSDEMFKHVGPVNLIQKGAPHEFTIGFSDAARKLAGESQHILMDYTIMKKWFNATGLKTADGKDFNDATLGEISQTITSLRAKHNYDNVAAIMNREQMAINLEKKSKNMMSLLNKVEAKYKVTSNVSLSNKEAQNFINIKKNPTVEEAAKHYVLTGYIDDIMGIQSVANFNHLHKLKEKMESGALDKEIKNLAKNPTFKALVEAHPDTYYKDMKQVEKDAKEMKLEYAGQLESFGDNPGLGEFVLHGIKVNAEMEFNGIKLRGERNTKDTYTDTGYAREDRLDQMYTRLGQVVLAQILTDPKNNHLLQGIAAGQYDIFEMKEKITDYIKEKNAFGLDQGKVDVKSLDQKLENGSIKKTIMDKVIGKIKPAELTNNNKILNDNNNIINNKVENKSAMKK